jgi:simple sugar transport system ATP-binding protein
MVQNSTEQSDHLISLRGIVKEFPGCLANDHVDLTIGHNEIHALLGENGAGKSTLVKIMYGVMKPDFGEIIYEGRPLIIKNPAHARELGICMVFQHFSLFESLTVVDNIALGLNDGDDRKDLRKRIIEISHSYGLPLDPNSMVHDLSVGERQRIEIVRCLLQKPKLLIMDEPTSVLTPQEVESLFNVLRRLAKEGCSILYISHKLQEIRTLCEKATIMRLGRVVAHCIPHEKTTQELAELMISVALKPKAIHRSPDKSAPVRLKVDRLTIISPHQFGTNLKNISFTVKQGEILGIAGIAGNGQTELMDALSGEVLSGTPKNIILDEAEIGHLGPRQRRHLGECCVPEERNGHGAVTTMTLSENAFLSGHNFAPLVRMGFINKTLTSAFATEIIRRFGVKTTGASAEARSLSGGNLQKFLVGREVQQNPSLLIINQPTWGVDAGAAVAIYDAIIQLAEQGTAVVIISQDLDEIMNLCDQIAVIAGGQLSSSIPVKEAKIADIGLLMGGMMQKDDTIKNSGDIIRV